jgi:hypothetical protein
MQNSKKIKNIGSALRPHPCPPLAKGRGVGAEFCKLFKYMSKNFKILLFLIAFGITAILVWIIVIGQNSDDGFMEKINNKEKSEVKVDLEKMRKEYKEGIGEAFAEFSVLKDNADLTVPRVEKIKNQALDLKVPSEFKDLHLDFVLAMVRMEDFIQTGSEEAKTTGEELIEKIKGNYPWLYNANAAN